MNDPILKGRLDMLQQNLQAALETTKHLAIELNDLKIPARFRDDLVDVFTLEAKNQLKAFENALVDLAEMDDPSAWAEYGKLSDQSSQLYREFLEAMLGLAIRVRGMDKAICDVADELIRSIRSIPVRVTTLTIPASQEAYARTLARLVRIRFPEWTIWSLPLTAHEFGHVVIDADPQLTALGDTEAKAEVESDSRYAEIKHKMEEDKKQLQALKESDPQFAEIALKIAQQKKKLDAAICGANCRIRQFLADAFAVYTIGPCYAASLIMLRLAPLSADPDERRASDAERAILVLEMLRKMNDTARKPKPYTEFIAKLTEAWDGIIARSGATPVAEFRRSALVDLASRAWKQFDQRFIMVQYPAVSPVGGWNVARSWSGMWEDAIIENKLPIPTDLTAKSKLRDALNAAWQYRLFKNPTTLEPVTDATRQLCDEIIRLWYDQEAKESESKAQRGKLVEAGRGR